MKRPWSCVLLVALAACSSVTRVKAPAGAGPLQVEPGRFPHELLDEVLGSFVDEEGLVDYEALKARPEALQRYLLYLERYSPTSHPTLFPAEADRLAYHLNAHNAFVLFGVIEHYPIRSVNDVKAFVELMQGFGFFYAQKFRTGNEEINLYNQVRFIRKLGDPRVHAALNCGALGCPILGRRAYRPEELDRQLDLAMRRFLAEDRNVLVDDARRTVYLSKIFQMYGDDFRKHGKPAGGSVLDSVAQYTEGERRAAVERARDGRYRIVFRGYDWSLNVQGARWQLPP